VTGGGVGEKLLLAEKWNVGVELLVGFGRDGYCGYGAVGEGMDDFLAEGHRSSM